MQEQPRTCAAPLDKGKPPARTWLVWVDVLRDVVRIGPRQLIFVENHLNRQTGREHHQQEAVYNGDVGQNGCTTLTVGRGRAAAGGLA
jgi:hypothetical protein